MQKQELTFGEVRALYFDDTALQLPPVPLYRLDVKGSRHYFTTDEDGELTFYSGVTTVTGLTLPKPEQLVKWIADMGYDNAIKYRDERAAYGTLMHTLFAHLLIDGRLDLADIDSLVEQYAKREGITVNVWQWADDLKQDVIAFMQWVHDYKVKPLAIEISLASKSMGIAGTADLPCLITIPMKDYWGEVYASGPRKGEQKETIQDVQVMAIVDFKSGRKSYGGDTGAAAQLWLYRELWVENIDNYPLNLLQGKTIRLYNWSPKDWRTKPGYHFADQTDSFSLAQMFAMLAMYKSSQRPVEEQTKTFYNGVVQMGEEPDGCYQVKTTPELASERLQEELPEGLDSRTWDYLTVGELMAEAANYGGL